MSIPLDVCFTNYEIIKVFLISVILFAAYRDVYLMFCLLNTSGTGLIDQSEFYQVYDVLCLKWAVREEEPFWFHRLRSRHMAAVINQVHRLITWKIFDYFIGLFIALNLFYWIEF